MKAQVLHDINDIRFEEVREPEIGQGEILIKIKATGICGSDIPRIYRDGAHNMPLIPGHEFAGEIIKCDEDAISGFFTEEDFVGKKAGVFPLIPCCNCEPCRQGKYEMCRNYDYIGSRRDGAFAEYISVPVENVVLLPDDISYEDAAMLEPAAVAIHAIRQTGLFSKSDIIEGKKPPRALVSGLGSIGLLTAMHLINFAVDDLLVIGNRDIQKKLALEIGVLEENFCDIRKEDPKCWIDKKTEGKGVEAFFECVGKNENVTLAVENTAPGGHVVLVGNPYSDMELEKSTYWKILRNQLTIHGTWNSSFTGNFNDDWNYCIEEITKENIKPSILITHRVSLENLEDGLTIMRDKKEDYVKVMMVQ